MKKLITTILILLIATASYALSETAAQQHSESAPEGGTYTVERVIDGDSVPRKTAREMRVGPSEPTCRSRLQSALSGIGQNPVS